MGKVAFQQDIRGSSPTVTQRPESSVHTNYTMNGLRGDPCTHYITPLVSLTLPLVTGGPSVQTPHYNENILWLFDMASFYFS